MTPQRAASSVRTEPRIVLRGSAPFADARGATLVELVAVLGVIGVVMAAAVPLLTRRADTAEAAAAARYVAATFGRTRLDAAREQRVLAVRFARATPTTFARFADGDGDGITAVDIAAGIDRRTSVPDRLEDHFPRVRFGIAASLPAIDAAGRLGPGDDPIRLGVADQWSVSPTGTATSGTLYIASRGGAQFAVRIAGVTGRARVLRFDRGSDTWRPY